MSQPFPPHVLREYALLADGERGGLIGPDGDIAWLCAPRWDSPSVFGTLLGGRGVYALTPLAPHVWGGYYEEGTLIWRSRWRTHTGIVESREALAFPGERDRLVLLRRVTAIDDDAQVRVVLDPRADYDTRPMRELRRDGTDWTAAAGDLAMRWCGAASASETDGALVLELTVPRGGHHDLVLELGRPGPREPLDPDRLWAQTEEAWRTAVPAHDSALAPRETRHNHAVLRGLTTADGGMVAAATTGLPESAEEGRNYDYRYVWIRDQSYAGQAMAAAGNMDDLARLAGFITARILQDGDRLSPAYRVDGTQVPEPRHVGLPGYPGGSDVVGNTVYQQFQLDAFGEALLLYAAGYEVLDADGRRAAATAAQAIADRWSEPDAGVWELDPKPWTHSRLIASAGLRAISRADPALEHWDRLAETVLTDTAGWGTHPNGHWQRARNDPRLDGALLLASIRGAVPPDDPHTVSTVKAYSKNLTTDGFAYRFRHDDRELGQAEGAFLMCGFLMALSLHQQGDPAGALGWWERTRTACGPPQLFSEEYDVVQSQMRGNLPQAFVHAFMIETSYRLAEIHQR